VIEVRRVMLRWVSMMPFGSPCCRGVDDGGEVDVDVCARRRRVRLSRRAPRPAVPPAGGAGGRDRTRRNTSTCEVRRMLRGVGEHAACRASATAPQRQSFSRCASLSVFVCELRSRRRLRLEHSQNATALSAVLSAKHHDAITRPTPRRNERVGQRVRARVELRVGEALPPHTSATFSVVARRRRAGSRGAVAPGGSRWTRGSSFTRGLPQTSTWSATWRAGHAGGSATNEACSSCVDSTPTSAMLSAFESGHDRACNALAYTTGRRRAQHAGLVSSARSDTTRTQSGASAPTNESASGAR